MTTHTRPARGTTDLDIVRAALDADYEVVAEIGRGGMAVVYEARERMLDRPVALKVLPFAMAHDDGFVERFEREARTAAQLEHPHVIPIYRVGRSEQVTYFVMKLLRGLSLADRLLEKGTLPPAEIRRVLVETAQALGYAHRRGVVHRDIKPENILLDEDDRCVVTDFGIARSSSNATLTAAGTSMGTPRYMSPEQARALPVDGRSDIYSLGVLGYQCLTGHPPFDGDDMMAIMLAHVTTPVPRPRGMTSEQADLYAVIERMLAKAPEHRFQSAEELIATLSGRAGASAVAAREVDAPARATPSARYGSIGEVPQSAAPLDRALEAGFEMLRQQKPKLDAGLQKLKEQKPKLDAGFAAGRRVMEVQRPKVRSALGRTLDSVRRMQERVLAGMGAHPKAWSIGLAVAALLAIGVPVARHFAVDHASRCPAGSADGSTSKAATAFTVLVDGGRSVRRDGDAEVYYDVCGLEKGTRYTAQVTLTRQQSGLRRLLNGTVAPLTETYDETAGGPAVRRHRSIDMDGMPAGAYSVSVVVTDAKGRRRTRGASFNVLGAEDDGR